ncbi:hypothetical protein P691DRAFT_199094 [Macrolepiota fuliginosa MF-IS2]|uniref:Uncharacterized protein n=1 Tax=Macrolepiota fuliginosa MF-IS2 TaxID=1400762 RepID=A0A9P5XNJ5_9AGAR|nr:hypothetical protein P691DRAFT_199094 [Macrolepiota fuliginosa MF-IS2]
MPRPGNFIVLNPNSSDRYTPLDNFPKVLEDDIDDAVTESEPDAEEEIDQLDSDSDTALDQQQQPDVPAPKKPPPSRSGERRPGQTLLPTVRIENILQAEGLLGNLSLSKEGIFLLSVATNSSGAS